MESLNSCSLPCCCSCVGGLVLRRSPDQVSFEKAVKLGAWHTQCPLALGVWWRMARVGGALAFRCAQRGWRVAEAEPAWSGGGAEWRGRPMIRQIMGVGELLGEG